MTSPTPHAHSLILLDDYQNISSSSSLVDWSILPSNLSRKTLTEPINHLSNEEIIEILKPFSMIHAMRERTKLPREILERLPNLKFITTTGMRNRGIDLKACEDLGIVVSGTSDGSNNSSTSTIEQSWALILSLSRRIVLEHNNLQSQSSSNSGNVNHWQTGLCTSLNGKVLGLIGLGRLGKQMVPIAKLFGMQVIGWSPNFTPERAKETGVEYCSSLDDLMRTSDFISVHVISSEKTKNLIGQRELVLMKGTGYLINTSRGPIVNESALIKALEEGKIQGVGLDVFDQEPLPLDHPFRKLKNVILSPHMGYVDDKTFEVFWKQQPENILAFLKEEPIRVMKRGSEAF